MKKLLFLMLAGIITLPVFSQKADDILGVWWNQEKDAKIEIYKDGAVYRGKIVWQKEPLNEAGKPKLDKNNPDKKLQSRPVMGLVVLNDLKWNKKEWDGGSIYDPKNGSTYSCYITMADQNTLKLRGYVGFSLIGRTATWERAK
jgi:uncharacterized protein (DUF2147 family)